MELEVLAQTIWAGLNELAIAPVAEFYSGLAEGDRVVLYILLVAAVAAGYVVGTRRGSRAGRRRSIRIGRGRFPAFQNVGETLVSDVVARHFHPPDYHLMNHVTIRMEDGTTQVDHILVSRFGVFVIETKHYKGWIFGSAEGRNWTQVRFRARFKFQNPLFQNLRHVRAVQGLLDFLPPDGVKSVVVFSGDAEFKTDVPEGVLALGQLEEYLSQQTEEMMSQSQLEFCVGRLETARLAITAQTDVEHVQSLAERHGRA